MTPAPALTGLYTKKIEENTLFADGDFSLEVSSSGVDEPLKLHRQYKKNIGRTIEVLLNNETKKQGKLIEVTNDELTIEEPTPKAKKKQLPKQGN